MGRPKGSSNRDKDEVQDEQVEETTQAAETTPSSVVKGIREGKKPKYDRKS